MLEQYRDMPESPFGSFWSGSSSPTRATRSISVATSSGRRISRTSCRRVVSVSGTSTSWDQIPHTLSTDARSLETQTSTGVFVLPSPRPPLSAYNLAPFPDVQTVGHRPLSGIWTPTLDLDLKADYTLTRESGDRPLSMGFGSPGNNFVEFIQPIDQTIHDFRIHASYAGEWWRVQGSYTLSIFQNGLGSLTAANPCFGLKAPSPPAGCGATPTAPPPTAGCPWLRITWPIRSPSRGP